MKINKALVLVVSLIVILLGIIVYLVLNLYNNKDSVDDIPPGGPQDIVDIGEIPTPEQVAILSEQLVKEVWGETFETLSEKEVLVLPRSGVTFTDPVITNNTDLAVLTVMAYNGNPYLQADYGDTNRSLPDGTSLDMRLLKMDYTDLKFYGYSNDTSKYLIKGNLNGDYFEQTVDLVKDKIKPLEPKPKQQE